MTTATVDTTHSEISFTTRHMMFAKVRGLFNKWTAKLDLDEANPAKSSVFVEIDAASIDTREEQRDAHLRSPDFFDTAKFPKITFRSKRVDGAAGGKKYKVVGDLTIRDQAHEVTLDVNETGRGKDPWGKERLGFEMHGTINRKDWGLNWNQVLEAGGVLVSEKVDIDVEAQVVLG